MIVQREPGGAEPAANLEFLEETSFVHFLAFVLFRLAETLCQLGSAPKVQLPLITHGM
jgi:hypothetical protein